MQVHSHVLSVPSPRACGWVTETDPKYARAWLASLPLADSAETGREIYQALYTLNRLDVAVATRFELVELYGPAVASVCAGLQSYLISQTPPLGPKKRQLAEFLRRLHVEMAYGYKLCLQNMRKSRFRGGQRARLLRATERALYHLGEVLLRSYVVYIPYPGGTWREVHELYCLAETAGIDEEAVGEGASDDRHAAPAPSIRAQYLRILLLGLANPYQLAQGMAHQVQAFIARWGDEAGLSADVSVANPAGRFLVDLDSDTPPQPFPTAIEPDRNRTRLRTVNLLGLVRTIRGFIERVEKGGSLDRAELGVDCIESSCVDLLRRLARLWGLGARRRYARREQRRPVLVCSGVEALHYFVNGQQSLDVARADRAPAVPADFIDLDRIAEHRPEPAATAREPVRRDHHRVDRWQVRDVGPNGMSLARYGDAQIGVRVGDLLGLQQRNDMGRWQTAVVRWLRSPETGSVELGLEFLGPVATPVAVRRLGADGVAETPFHVALQLPADPALRRPPTLVVVRGLFVEKRDLELLEADGIARRVRPLRLLERTGAFEQFVYAEVAR